MIHNRRRFIAASSAIVGLHALWPAMARAQDKYPSKPARIIVPYAPGAASDTLGRFAAEALTTSLKQTFIVENRSGGGTVIGSRAVSMAAPDGYVLGFVDTSFVINPGLLGDKLPYDTLKDFVPITQICTAPFVLVVHPSVKAQTLKEFIALAKANPGTLTYGSSGIGSAQHLAEQQLRQEAGIDTVHVPYRGGSTVYTDLMGGQVQFSFGTVPSLLEHIRSGRMRALALTTPQRVAALPGIPTMAEEGYPGVNLEPLFGLIAPAQTPGEIVAQIQSVVAASVNSGALNIKLKEVGFTPIGSTSAAFSETIKKNIAMWTEVIRRGNIKPE